MLYTSNLRRVGLQNYLSPLNLTESKWALLLPSNFKFKWENTWDAEKARKEGGLILSLLYKVVVIDTWQGKIWPLINVTRKVCNSGEAESSVHRFRSCGPSQHAWLFVTFFLDKLSGNAGTRWNLPTWQPALFAQRPPRCYQQVSRLWLLLQCITLFATLDCYK